MKKILGISLAAGVMAFGGMVLSNPAENPQAGLADRPAVSVEQNPDAGNKEAPERDKLDDEDGQETRSQADRQTTNFTANEEADDDENAASADPSKQAANETEQPPPLKNEQRTASKYSLITEAQAVEAARQVASGKVDDVELEREQGHYYYEVEFEDGDIEYEVIVDALDGKIVYVEKDVD